MPPTWPIPIELPLVDMPPIDLPPIDPPPIAGMCPMPADAVCIVLVWAGLEMVGRPIEVVTCSAPGIGCASKRACVVVVVADVRGVSDGIVCVTGRVSLVR